MIRKSLLASTVLSLGLTLGIAPPVMAAEKAAKAAVAPKVTPSKAFMATAVATQKAVETAKTNPEAVGAARTAVDGAFTAATTADDKYFAGQFALNLGGIAKDPALQRRGLAAMIESGKVAPADLAKVNYYAGSLAYEIKDYPGSIPYLTTAYDGGFRDPDGILLPRLLDAYKRTGNSAAVVALIQKDLATAQAAGTKPAETSIRNALQAALDGKQMTSGGDYAAMLVQNYPGPAAWNSAIYVVRTLGSGAYGPQPRLDLARLAFQTKTLDDRSEFIEYIQDADPRRLPGEVLKIINLAISSGKLKATDMIVGEAKPSAEGRLAKDKTDLPLLERGARASSARLIDITAAADTLLSYEDYAKAADLYKLALTKSGVDQAEVLTRLGIAQTMLGQTAEAQTNFAKVTGARQPIAKLWSVFAAQKGTPVGAAPAG